MRFIDQIKQSPITWKSGIYISPCLSGGTCSNTGQGPKGYGRRYAYNDIKGTAKLYKCCTGCHSPIDIAEAAKLNLFLNNDAPTFTDNDFMNMLEGF